VSRSTWGWIGENIGARGIQLRIAGGIDVKSPCRGALALPGVLSMLTLFDDEAAAAAGHSRNRSRRPMAGPGRLRLNAQAIGTPLMGRGRIGRPPGRSPGSCSGPTEPHVPGESRLVMGRTLSAISTPMFLREARVRRLFGVPGAACHRDVEDHVGRVLR